VGSACGSSSSGPGGDRDGKLTTYHTTDPGGAVVLKDRAGNSLAVGSTTAYSPEATCGGCHDVATITMGYHFQQGADVVSDTYNPTKSWLLSDGMYGKW
jgi:hypothetical protein